jgi:hypothetical protein
VRTGLECADLLVRKGGNVTTDVISVFAINGIAGAMGGVIQIVWQELKGKKLPLPSFVDRAFQEPLPIAARKKLLFSNGIFAAVFGGVYGWGLLAIFGSANMPNDSAQLFGAFIVGYVARCSLAMLHKQQV